MTLQRSPAAAATAGNPRWVWVAFGIAATLVAAGIGFWLADAQRVPHGALVAARVHSKPDSDRPPWFRDVTDASGVEFTYRNGQEAGHLTILESVGGGVALFDFDGDGLLDIFVTGGGTFDKPRSAYPEDTEAYIKAVGHAPPALVGQPCKLYRNLGNLKFQDVTHEVGLDVPWFYTHGVAVADYDRDGWPDLLVTGYGQVRLLHNEPGAQGGRRFVDVTARLGLIDTSWATSAGWADLDGDGWPDLYVCHYADWSFAKHPSCAAQAPGVAHDVCPPQSFDPLVHALFRNEQGKRFRDIAQQQGFRAQGCGLGVVLADLNDDGRPDIYVANDAAKKLLFLNRGGKLEECGEKAGVALDDEGRYNGSMGVDVGDYDGSGRPSLWVTNFQNDVHNLYRNLGREVFHDQSRAAGILALGQQFVAFGTSFVDVDNDGWEDLVIVNGHVLYHPRQGSTLKQRPVLLRNIAFQGRRVFKDVSTQGGAFFQTPLVSRGLAVGDLDNDGWPDLVVSNVNGPVTILRNEGRGAARFLGVRLIGKDHRDVVGSTVSLEQTDGRVLTRFAKGGGSYLSASDPRILFGLGASAGVQRITVKWSWSQSQTWEWDDHEPHGYWELREGEAEPRRMAAPSQ